MTTLGGDIVSAWAGWIDGVNRTANKTEQWQTNEVIDFEQNIIAVIYPENRLTTVLKSLSGGNFPARL